MNSLILTLSVTGGIFGFGFNRNGGNCADGKCDVPTPQVVEIVVNNEICAAMGLSVSNVILEQQTVTAKSTGNNQQQRKLFRGLFRR